MYTSLNCLLNNNLSFMENLPQLISDLALILLCAGIMTILFKKLKQPVVLGYIVAGFIASPYMPYIPSVVDSADISTWADIGVIFLLFSLGLEFSFKKLLKAGSTPVIAVIVLSACMIGVGIIVGKCFGWSFMNGLYLGGMIAMSSTGIIVKAFDDMGLRQQKFASLVISVLILEDIVAIIMLLLFGTLGGGGKVSGSELLLSMGKMVFYLILWFVLGIYLIPLLLKKTRPLMNDETLLIVSLALCFLMVVLASLAGFSPAFGAFVMGSILAETVESEHIEHLVTPLKDTFAAVFFVSVGMMINPAMIAKYWLPIIIITLVVLIVRSIIGIFSFMLGGADLRTSVQSSLSLAPVGEFSFILATLGISLGAISDFIYPIIVSVSVITIFVTPSMMRLADPITQWIEPRIPERLRRAIDRYDAGSTTAHDENKWKKMLSSMLTPMLVYGVLCIALLVLSFQLAQPLASQWIPAPWDRITCLLATLLILTPFLRPLLLKGCFTKIFWELWNDKQFNRAPLLAIVLFRAALVVLIIIICIQHFLHPGLAVFIGVVALMLIALLFSRQVRTRQQRFEDIFRQNLNSKELAQRPAYAGKLQSRDIHLTELEVPSFPSWAGSKLCELQWGSRFDVQVASVQRNGRRFNIPGPNQRIFPGDRLQLIGTDEGLRHFMEAITEEQKTDEKTVTMGNHEMRLQQLIVDATSPIVGHTLRETGTRDKYHCLIVGVDRGEDALIQPSPDFVFMEGDVIWVVGEDNDVLCLVNRASHKEIGLHQS